MEKTIAPKLSFGRQLRKSALHAVNTVTSKGKQNIIIAAALLLLIIIFSLLNPNFIKDKYNVISMVQSFAPYAILGLGVTFVIATGGIDLSIGTVCIAASVIAGKLYTSGKVPLWTTVPIMIAVGAVFGVLNGLLVAELKLPAFIATLGTMMFSRGLSAILVADPNIFYPGGTWFNTLFSNANGLPVGLLWVIGIAAVCMYLMYKCKIGRYILSIGSNEEATRLSGIQADKYKIIAYTLSGIGAGIAAIFWSATFTTVASATGNGMELDAIAGVYIGGTSAAGGVASITGSVIGALMLVVIRQGLNLVLATFELNLNSTYVTYVLTGVIVVAAVLLDVVKNKNAGKVRVETAADRYKKNAALQMQTLQDALDWILAKNNPAPKAEKAVQATKVKQQIAELKQNSRQEYKRLKSAK